MSLTERWERWALVEEAGHRERATLFRVAFFGVLAVDCWTNLAHLGRYGAGHFNVSHFPALDGLLPAPEKEWMVALVLLQVFLALRALLGSGLRWTLPLLAAAYSATYFWSQLDSYQHHYLVALMLWVLAAGVTLERREDLAPWSLRGLAGLVSVVYFWAAVTKMDPLWLDGRTLSTQITPDWARSWFEGRWALAAWLVLLGELALAVGWQLRRAWAPTLAVGLGLHVGIEVLDFRIGVFSYFMAALYVLLLPAGAAGPLVRQGRRLLPQGASQPWTRPLAAAGVTAGLAGLWGAFGAAAVVSAVAAGGLVLVTERRQGYRPLLAVALIWALHLGSDVARDYWRYVGGDTRRRGQVDEAIDAYTHVTRLDPDYFSGHLRLGDLYMKSGDTQRAMAEYEAARALEPDNPELRDRMR